MLRETLDALVRFPTATGDTEAAQACLGYVRAGLQGVPLFVREYTFGGFPSLVATTRRTKRPTLWLAAHIDVVPASTRAFVPTYRNGKLFGRGTFDMKCAVACYIRLLQELGADAQKYNLGLMLTSDEEWGGFHGTKRLLAQGYGGSVAFLPDGGGVWQFEEAAKGKWQVEVESRGVAVHGSRPWNGTSATHELVRFLAEAEHAFDTFKANCNDEAHWHLTMHAGLLSGGQAANTVADHASAVLDIRYCSQREVRRAEGILARLTKKHTGTSWRTVHREDGCTVARSNPYIRRFAQIARSEGRVCGFTRSHGSSDARFFAERGIPTLLIWPEGGGHHTAHEWVDLTDLERYYRVLRRFVEETARVQSARQSGRMGNTAGLV